MKKVNLQLEDKTYAQLSSLCYEGRYQSIEKAIITIVSEVVESNWAFPELSKEGVAELEGSWVCLHENEDVSLTDIDGGKLPCGKCEHIYCPYYDKESLARKILKEHLH